MNIILSVYSEVAFKEYQLPSLNNADYQITLSKDFFQLEENLALDMEVLDKKWKIKRNACYKMLRGREDYRGESLEDNDVISIQVQKGERLSLIVKYVDSIFHPYEKYRLKNVESVTIGKDPGNDIQYDYLRMVSRSHAVIEKEGDSYKITNKSLNGIYVNSRRIDQTQVLEWGSYINVMGLHLVFLGDILAVDANGSRAHINEKKLVKYSVCEEETVFLKKKNSLSQGKEIYHRAPRNYETVDPETIEIEAPPQLNPAKQQPLYLAIGPSVTMALPMFLGCILMMNAAGNTGSGSSLSMYSGLAMSVSSAVIGVVWALASIRYQKKEEARQAKQRFDVYGAYLLEKTEEIKKKYTETAGALTEIYPDAATEDGFSIT